MAITVTTPYFRVSWPNVFKPKKNTLNNKDEYSLTALFPKGADLSQIQAAMKSVCAEKWGNDPTKWPKNLRNPLKDQATLTLKEKGTDQPLIDKKTGKPILQAGCEEGAMFINLKSEQRPGLVDSQVQPILDQADFYPGCWARASLSVFAYDQAGNKGVSFGLMNIQKVKEDEPLAGRTKPEQDFAPIATENTSGGAGDLFK
jgi:hypothetical protein